MARLAAGVRKRKNGTLEKRFTVNGKRYSVYGKTTRILSQKERELREQLQKGLLSENLEITLDLYFEEWILRKQSTVKDATLYRYRSQYRNNISPLLGRRKLSRITRREVYVLQQDLKNRFDPNTANYILRILRMILSDAVNDELIAKNPVTSIRALRTDSLKAIKTVHRALTEIEQTVFMQAAKDSYYYEYFALLLQTGLRSGEAAALQWGDIDYEKNLIHVSKTLTFSNEGHVIVGTPKTSAGNRDIPMNESIRKVVRTQRYRLYNQFGEAALSNDAPVFLSVTGRTLHNRSGNRELQRILQKLEEERTPIRHFTLHALRDTFATRFIEQGGSPQTLKAILGHKSLGMTMDLYSQVLPNTKQKEMNQLKIGL